MKRTSPRQELHHEIFGSVLDRTDMSPFLLLSAPDYETALKQATKMMGNRGFDISGDDVLQMSEKQRAHSYLERAYDYFLGWMFPFVKTQLEALADLRSANTALYRDSIKTIGRVESILQDTGFRNIADEDPRHLFLLASSRKYPHVFYGYHGANIEVPVAWQQTACSLLKMGHLIKSIEEDSQDINDYAQLGLFLEMQGHNLDDLYHYDWEHPVLIPESEAAQKAFVKVSTFFHKLNESVKYDAEKGCLVFNSGDGVDVEIVEIKARLKSPESMFTKLGKDVEGEAYDIQDVLAITFVLKNRDDTLMLFHALQKRGVILQENTASHSITQTLFDSPEAMVEAVRRLILSLSRSEGINEMPDEQELHDHAKKFYDALSVHGEKNLHSSSGHRKFQCKIAFSLPIHRTAKANLIMIPGMSIYQRRDQVTKKTQQHTLWVELRISDEQSWRMSEQKGDAHHDAYKFRQLIFVMNRVFKNVFRVPEESIAQLRNDQSALFS